jgi:hypothetical protein
MSDWIEHDGGACPVDRNVRVWSLSRKGNEWPIYRAGTLCWSHCGGDFDIIAYRLAEPKTEPQAHIPIPGAIPLDDLIDKLMQDPELAAEMEKARPELQAHMMSAPDMGRYAPDMSRKHMSDAAWDARRKAFPQLTTHVGRDEWEKDHVLAGTVLLTVAELDAKNVEIQRLQKQADFYRERYQEARREVCDRLIELEQLRKGVMPNAEGLGATAAARTEGAHAVAGDASAKTRGLMTVADNLGHRLGIAQPEGEPCEPRPAGARWRAMV